jgi:hypothetical protein
MNVKTNEVLVVLFPIKVWASDQFLGSTDGSLHLFHRRPFFLSVELEAGIEEVA